MNSVPNEHFEGSGEDLHDNSQVSGARPQIGNDHQTGLYHDDSMVGDGAYNAYPNINHNILRHGQPSPIHEVSSTDGFPTIKASDGNLDLSLGEWADFVNSHSLSQMLAICPGIQHNHPENGIQPLVHGTDEKVDLNPTHALIPSGNQPQSINGQVDRRAIDYDDIIAEFCKKRPEICVPPQDCSLQSRYVSSYDTEPQSSIGRTELGNSEIQPNHRAVRNHYRDYLANQYDYEAGVIHHPDLGRLQRTVSS